MHLENSMVMCLRKFESVILFVRTKTKQRSAPLWNERKGIVRSVCVRYIVSMKYMIMCARAMPVAYENRMLASVKHVRRRRKSSPSIDFDRLSAKPLSVSTPRTYLRGCVYSDQTQAHIKHE